MTRSSAASCGYALGTASAVSASGVAVAPAPAEPNPVAAEPKPKSVRAPFVVAAVLVALFIFFAVLTNRSSTSNRNASTIDQFVKQQHTQNISNSALAVNATLSYDTLPQAGSTVETRRYRNFAPFVRQTGERKAQTCANEICQQLSLDGQTISADSGRSDVA